MSDTPELDQVDEARRKIASHAGFPRWYWAAQGIALVLIVGVPLWQSYLPAGGGTLLAWVIFAVVAASAVYAVVRRRRTGVHLPRRMHSYSSKARRFWLAGLVVAAFGFLGVDRLVDHGQRGLAIVVVVAVAVVVFGLQMATRSAMRADIEAGRARP